MDDDVYVAKCGLEYGSAADIAPDNPGARGQSSRKLFSARVLQVEAGNPMPCPQQVVEHLPANPAKRPGQQYSFCYEWLVHRIFLVFLFNPASVQPLLSDARGQSSL
jgi:hypothetical protein